MATAQARALTQAYRRQQLALAAQTTRDLVRLWPALDWQAIERTYPAWFAGVQALIARDRLTANGLASVYLRAFRAAEGAPGALRLVFGAPLNADALATSLRVTTTVAFKRAVGAGFPLAKASATAFVLSSGAITRHVLDAGRDTIRETTIADPACQGWQRVGSGECAFCSMLIGRGAVYSESTADFGSHDHCQCSAEPVFGGERRQVREFEGTDRNISDADRARVRAWIAKNA